MSNILTVTRKETIQNWVLVNRLRFRFAQSRRNGGRAHMESKSKRLA
jgi:hypothetical protein